MGFAFLPIGIGSLIGGWFGGKLIHHFGEVTHQPELIWWAVMAVGVATAGLLWIYDKTLKPSSPKQNQVLKPRRSQRYTKEILGFHLLVLLCLCGLKVYAPDSLKTLPLFRIVVCPWTFPPFKPRSASGISTPGFFTITTIAILLRTACLGCPRLRWSRGAGSI